VTVAVVVGNPKPRSRTWRAACIVAQQLTGAEPDVNLDLTELGPRLLDWSDPDVAAAVGAILESDLVVVASPTYKASYTGLLKLFLDRFAAGSLIGVTTIPLMLGGDWRHSLAPETFLKPVLAELGAASPTRGLFLLDSGADAGWAADPVLEGWLSAARRQLPTHLVGTAASARS
jgi:FMN reductase